VSTTDLARHVVTALIEGGVTDVVVAPGSRNAPLSFAVLDAAGAGLLRLHTRIDERSAGFLALGLTKVGARAAVLCTSGTAVANLHPAMLEAVHAGVPMVAVTADRPERLRGTSANQTTEQVGILGWSVPVVDVADGDVLTIGPGPLHVNVGFDEPLVPAARWVPDGVVGPSPRPSAGSGPRPAPEVLASGPATVVVAGDDAGPPARVLAQTAGWPLLAEPTSGSRTGTHAIRTYRLILEGDLGARVQRVVVAGHPTLSRPVARLLARADVEVIDMTPGGLRRPFEVDREVLAPAVECTDDPAWLEEWQATDSATARALDGLLATEPGLTPYAVAGAVSRALPPEGLLVVGASNPIRDLDLMVARYQVGDRRKVIANRGLAGIDGTVSTAIGAALGRPRTSRALALMGDVTFLHDSNGLILGPDEPRPDLTVVVVNDNGGSIFATLEQGAPEHGHAFERLFGTPHGVDLAALCAATRTPHWRVDSAPELEHALANPNGGIEVIEAVVDRAGRRDLDQRIRALGAG
jgi:2-succinyl-5-enolpyruvyl-6-hydroxy-3-cyclohexene-1-carboxylate synthase